MAGIHRHPQVAIPSAERTAASDLIPVDADVGNIDEIAEMMALRETLHSTDVPELLNTPSGGHEQETGAPSEQLPGQLPAPVDVDNSSLVNAVCQRDTGRNIRKRRLPQSIADDFVLPLSSRRIRLEAPSITGSKAI